MPAIYACARWYQIGDFDLECRSLSGEPGSAAQISIVYAKLLGHCSQTGMGVLAGCSPRPVSYRWEVSLRLMRPSLFDPATDPMDCFGMQLTSTRFRNAKHGANLTKAAILLVIQPQYRT